MIKKGERRKKNRSVRPSVRSLQLMSSLHTYRIDIASIDHDARSVCSSYRNSSVDRAVKWRWKESPDDSKKASSLFCPSSNENVRREETHRLAPLASINLLLPSIDIFFSFLSFFSFCASDLSIGEGESICGSNHRATRPIFVNCFFSSISVSVNTEINCQFRVESICIRKDGSDIVRVMKWMRFFSPLSERFIVWITIWE